MQTTEQRFMGEGGVAAGKVGKPGKHNGMKGRSRYSGNTSSTLARGGRKENGEKGICSQVGERDCSIEGDLGNNTD